MEDLHWEVTLRELNAPSRDPPPTPWGNPEGNGDPDVDDWEVTFLRGEGGNPEDNHFHPCSPTTRWKVGTQDNLLGPQHLLNLMRMWDALSTHLPCDCDLVPLT